MDPELKEDLEKIWKEYNESEYEPDAVDTVDTINYLIGTIQKLANTKENSIKRYLVFAGSNYYPERWGDYLCSFDSLEAASLYVFANKDKTDWIEIIDLLVEQQEKENK